MRTVKREQGRLTVSDDPNGAIAVFLECASSDRSVGADAFAPEGEGYAAPATVSVLRLTTREDIPPGWDEHIPFEPDVWVIFRDRPGRSDRSGMHIAWLRGDELRALFDEARRLSNASAPEVE